MTTIHKSSGPAAGRLVLAYPSTVSPVRADAEGAEARVGRATGRLLERCDAEILAAQLSSDPADTFLHAHFAALRAAGAILEARGRAKVRGRGRNVWQLAGEFVPELAEWVQVFSRSARVRAAIEAGDLSAVDTAVAEQALAAAEDFRDAVAVLLAGDATGARRAVVRAS
ncbi:hypothetical protein ATL41_0595 [Flavimobilis soli]|uniref:SAV-6107-like HEPN domain-containing protein n=1 Tax=Flavimobilis soli TaxID=442709 RepID=A0A2A9EC82_9MICO|nr:SAV_6107 family HEPN domain-containing protein [Flavimobilis soli]PFG35895.1 hypothetical protein ATL41_0595 [Flavimobilis soli]